MLQTKPFSFFFFFGFVFIGFLIDIVVLITQKSIFTCQNKRKQALLGSNLPGIILTVDENVNIKGLVLYQPFDIFVNLSCLKKIQRRICF
jgi:hypothetical protein